MIVSINQLKSHLHSFNLNLFNLRHIKQGVQGLQAFAFCVLPVSDKHMKQTQVQKKAQELIIRGYIGAQPFGVQRSHASPLLPLPTSISEPDKFQEFQFQTSGILLLMGVQKLYGPEISQVLPCMPQFFENSRWLFIFSNYIREIVYFTLDLVKRSDT